MDLGLAGKNALLLSSTSGLGLGCAMALAKEGVNIAINGRDIEKGEKALEEIPGKGVFIQGDITKKSERERIVVEAKQKLGTISILVTNADGPNPGSFLRKDANDWMIAYTLILESAVDIVTKVVPEMIANNFGRIINISSTSAKETVPGSVFANTFKPALIGALNTLAKEITESSVTINHILPGPFDTYRIRKYAEGKKSHLNPEQAFRAYEEELPMKRTGKIEEFGALCAFLCSKYAGYITGQSIVIDGGQIKAFL